MDKIFVLALLMVFSVWATMLAYIGSVVWHLIA